MSIRTRILVGALGLAVTAGLVGSAAAQTPSPTVSHSVKAVPPKSAKVHVARHAEHAHVAHRLLHKHVAARHLVKRHLAGKHVGAKQHLAKRIALSHRA